jgi:hypothetical protein
MNRESEGYILIHPTTQVSLRQLATLLVVRAFSRFQALQILGNEMFAFSWIFKKGTKLENCIGNGKTDCMAVANLAR